MGTSRSRPNGEFLPLTFGQALAAHVRIITWCERCQHSFEPNVADLVQRYGAATALIDWAKRLRCSKCGGGATIVISDALRLGRPAAGPEDGASAVALSPVRSRGSAENCPRCKGGFFVSARATIRSQDLGSGRVDVGHQLGRRRIHVRVIAPGQSVISRTEFRAGHHFRMDAEAPEQIEGILQRHSRIRSPSDKLQSNTWAAPVGRHRRLSGDRDPSQRQLASAAPRVNR